MLAKNLADRVAKHFMMEYVCRLAEGEMCRGYELKVDDPVAKLLSRYFCMSTPERKIDHSPGIAKVSWSILVVMRLLSICLCLNG